MAHNNKRSTQIDFSRLRRNLSSPRIPATIEEVEDSTESDSVETQSHERNKTNVALKADSMPREYERTRLKDLNLLDAVRTGVRADKFIKEVQASPLKAFETSYDIRLGSIDEFVTVVRRRQLQSSAISRKGFLNLAILKVLKGPDIKGRIQKLKDFQHTNIISPFEIYHHNGICYGAFEYAGFSLYYVNGSELLDEARLSAIVGQILHGLAFLASHGLEHNCLDCSNIIIYPYGDVKIAGLENCEYRSTDMVEPRYIECLKHVTMNLMQDYDKEDGAIGIGDLKRWRPDSNATTFLSATTSVSSLEELSKHPLLKTKWQKEVLQDLVCLTSISARIAHVQPSKLMLE